MIKRVISVTAAGGFGMALAMYHFESNNPRHFSLLKTCLLEANSADMNSFLKPPVRSDLPTYSIEEVKRHGRSAERIWVTFKQGIYDITEFVELHPGGDKILLAAGDSIEPFWAIYAQHKTEEVLAILEELRIGNLSTEGLEAIKGESSTDDPFDADPHRHPALVVNMQKPFNAETPASLLVDNFVTPNELFFVRNHMPVPKTDELTHTIFIDGIGIDKPICLSIDDLRNKFEPITLTSTIQCAGNRRNDMNQFKKVQGLMWTGTAISNAKWKGCRLRDILIDSGINAFDSQIKHIHFEGADVDASGSHYGASIPFEKAMGPEVILAFEMNDKKLTRDHGYPVRVIVPGNVGARQVKWLTRIHLSTEESPSNWQRRDYKAFPNSVQIGDQPPYATTPSIQEYPVQSAICVPAPNTRIPLGTKTINISGYAWSGGGRGIIRVEVSSDNGKTWKCADLLQSPDQDLEHMWAWTQWNVELPVPEEALDQKHFEIICKATDRSYNTQPETPAGLWNVRGLLHNAWHRVPITFG